jgi:chorismate mutase
MPRSPGQGKGSQRQKGDMTLENWRKRIDELDLQIVGLLNQRAHAALQIGKLKQATSLPVYEPAREKVIYERVRAANPGPLPDIELVRIYERIIDVMRTLQQDELASQKSSQTAESGPGESAAKDPKPRSK